MFKVRKANRETAQYLMADEENGENKKKKFVY